MFPKQVIVVRKDLKMRQGKVAAQASHSSNAILLDNLGKVILYKFLNLVGLKIDNAWFNWLNGSFTKICVYVNSEAELDNIYKLATDNKLPCSLIVDSGRTEFNNVPTKTVVAIGPCNPIDFIGITDKLPLL